MIAMSDRYLSDDLARQAGVELEQAVNTMVAAHAFRQGVIDGDEARELAERGRDHITTDIPDDLWWDARDDLRQDL